MNLYHKIDDLVFNNITMTGKVWDIINAKDKVSHEVWVQIRETLRDPVRQAVVYEVREPIVNNIYNGH